MTRTNFTQLRIYQLAEELADLVWDLVSKWNHLALSTIGRQLANAADSIGANIAEGTGRGSAADNRRFARIARGSLFEVKHWLRRAYSRKLLTEEETGALKHMVDELTPKLSAYINAIGKEPKSRTQSSEDN